MNPTRTKWDYIIGFGAWVLLWIVLAVAAWVLG